MSSPSRRGVLAGLGAALVAPFAAPARTRADDAPIRFTHVYGETVLPRPATRVVSLGYTTQDPLLALGVTPLATRGWFGDEPGGVWPWARDRLAGPVPVVLKGALSIERVAALRPDLIVGIGSAITATEYAALSRLAPVLMQPAGDNAYGTPWDATTTLIARAVGAEALAQTRVAEARAAFGAARARHPTWAGASAVAAYHHAGETGVFLPGDTRARFLAEVGFAVPPAIARLAKGSFFAKLSPEDLSALDADLVMWIATGDSAPDLAALPMRRVLRATREGREVFSGGLLAAALSFGSVLSLPYALAALEADLAAALDGDPATPVASARKVGLVP